MGIFFPVAIFYYWEVKIYVVNRYKKSNFWSAPSDLEPEKFKKPSTKRLAKKAANKDINSSKIKHT